MPNLKVNQFHSGTAYGDAITNEMLAICRMLSSAGFDSRIYAEHVAPELAHTIQDIKQYKGSVDNVLLVHHSMGFDCFNRIMNLPDRKILIYHNVTPTEFFRHDPVIASYAEKGRLQLLAYRDHVEFAFADSEYNRRELEDAGFTATDVLPVTFGLEELQQAEPNPTLLEKFGSSTNFLFVGRIVPNKKQEDIIKAFSYYHQNISSAARLFLIGGFEGFEWYYEFLNETVKEANLSDRVFLPGRVKTEDLVAYYRTASVFLSMSEHEGFGVPLVESMLFDVPVVAYKASAVPLTLGGAGVLFTRKDIPLIAEMVDRIIRDQLFRKAIINAQRRRLEELSPRQSINRLIKKVEEVSLQVEHSKNASRRSVQIQGPFETSYSLAVVNRNLARALSRKAGIDVTLFATEGPGDYTPKPGDLVDKPDVEQMWRKSVKSGPSDYIIRNLYPPRVHDVNPAHLNFFYFYWEDSLMPGEWADDFNRYLDGIMVASRHVRSALRNSGVAIPVGIIHTGVEFETGAHEKSFDLGTKKSFKFLHVSSGFPRKGCDVLLRAYAAEFSSEDDVCLVIKTFPNIHNTVAEQIEQIRSRTRRCPEIIHINRDLTPYDMRSLYRSVSCLVHPVRAEGFGLPVAEAMLARLPVIVTNYSGLTEFCNEDTALLVGYKLAPSGSHFKVEGAEWAEPDEAELRAHLRAVYENPASPDITKKVERAFVTIKEGFTWDLVADRALSFMRGIENQTRRLIRAGMVTTWNSKCGIAEYSKYLLGALQDRNIRWSILAQQGEATIGAEPGNVTRCWRDRWHCSLSSLLSEVRRQALEIVHFQFNFGFFELAEFARAVLELRAQGRHVFITFHSTEDTLIDGQKVSLSQIASSLKQVDRIFVHNEEDRRRLAAWGIRENVTHFPHGFLTFDDVDRNSIRQDLGLRASTIISTFGFLLPHKGLIETIEALRILKRSHPDVVLLALTSLHPDARSRAHYDFCMKRVSDLGLSKDCKIITEFLSPEEIVTALQASDVVVLPYHQTSESSSAAIRLPLASHRPVITTRQPIFNDVSNEVHQIESAKPEVIAEGIRQLLSNSSLAQEIVKCAVQRVSKDSWSQIARMYSKFIRGACL